MIREEDPETDFEREERNNIKSFQMIRKTAGRRRGQYCNFPFLSSSILFSFMEFLCSFSLFSACNRQELGIFVLI